MKLPESVKIGPHTIPISELPETADCFGQYLSDPPSIEIRKGSDETQRADVLLHEILHCLWRDAQIGILMQVEDLNDREEAMVRVLATQLTQILRENPKVTKFITGSK
jgi:hypothetical protein